MIITSMADAYGLLPSLSFPLLAIGMVDGLPYWAVITKDAKEYADIMFCILDAHPTAHVIVTSLTGDTPERLP